MILCHAPSADYFQGPGKPLLMFPGALWPLQQRSTAFLERLLHILRDRQIRTLWDAFFTNKVGKTLKVAIINLGISSASSVLPLFDPSLGAGIPRGPRVDAGFSAPSDVPSSINPQLWSLKLVKALISFWPNYAHQHTVFFTAGL